MLKFKVDAVYNSYVQPACLPLYSNYEPSTNVSAYLVGYGAITESGTDPLYLQNAVATYYVSGNECANYGSFFYPKTEICAGKQSPWKILKKKD